MITSVQTFKLHLGWGVSATISKMLKRVTIKPLVSLRAKFTPHDSPPWTHTLIKAHLHVSALLTIENDVFSSSNMILKTIAI